MNYDKLREQVEAMEVHAQSGPPINNLISKEQVLTLIDTLENEQTLRGCDCHKEQKGFVNGELARFVPRDCLPDCTNDACPCHTPPDTTN